MNEPEKHETLRTFARFHHSSNPIQTKSRHLVADSVVAAGEITGGVFFTGQHELPVEKPPVRPRSDFICQKKKISMIWSAEKLRERTREKE